MRKVVDESWDDVWKHHKELNFFGKILFKNKYDKFRKILPTYFNKHCSMIDVGCGAGNVLAILRFIGYRRAIGIDPSEQSMKLCEKKGFRRGKDIFKSDSSKWKKKYDVVWSDGLLEHFDYEDMKGICKDFVRMSKQFISFTQPNPDALISKFIDKSGWEWERPYSKDDYIKVMESLGFHLIHFSYINFKEQYLFIFEKNEGKK